MTARYAKIAITLPPEDLAAADRLARQHDRSRSWIVAEAVRRYVAEQERTSGETLDASRRAQLQRDLSLTAEQRLREAEDIAVVPQDQPGALEQPRVFRTYDEFAEWRRRLLRSAP